jgi:hypothetical protein
MEGSEMRSTTVYTKDNGFEFAIGNFVRLTKRDVEGMVTDARFPSTLHGYDIDLAIQTEPGGDSIWYRLNDADFEVEG